MSSWFRASRRRHQLGTEASSAPRDIDEGAIIVQTAVLATPTFFHMAAAHNIHSAATETSTAQCTPPCDSVEFVFSTNSCQGGRRSLVQIPQPQPFNRNCIVRQRRAAVQARPINQVTNSIDLIEPIDDEDLIWSLILIMWFWNFATCRNKTENEFSIHVHAWLYLSVFKVPRKSLSLAKNMQVTATLGAVNC